MHRGLKEPVRAFMTRGVVSLDADDTVLGAAKKMQELDIGSLLVTKTFMPFGIITERDIIKKVVAKGLDPQKTKISKIMSVNLLRIDADMDIASAITIMAEKGIRHLLVEDNNKIIGVFSIRNYLDLERKRIASSISSD